MFNRTPSSALMLAPLAAAQETKPQRDGQAYQSYRAGERAEYAVPACTAPEGPKPWWQRAGEWISSPSTWWGFSTEDEAIKLMQKAKGFPDVPIVLPMLKGFGMDDVAGPLKYTLKTDTTIRLIGRVMDDASPGVLTGIGLGLTVTPNLVKNIRNKSPWNQTTADLLVDTGGFVVSEAAGWVIGGAIGLAVSLTPLAPAAAYITLGVKIFVDGVVSIGWDHIAERYRWSDWVSQRLEKGAQALGENIMESMRQAFDTKKYPPVPTPPMPMPTGTPIPEGHNTNRPVLDIPRPGTDVSITPDPTPAPSPQEGEDVR